PDREIPHAHNQVVAPVPINGTNGAVKANQQFRVLQRGDPGRKDVTPQAANIAEANAIGLTSMADEIAKRGAPHGGWLLYSKGTRNPSSRAGGTIVGSVPYRLLACG